MSFVTNPAQQMTINDSIFNLTNRERKALEKSWAKPFAEEIFPMIDEKPFRVIYCEDNGAPNTPVNIIIGACIIKELLDLSDDEIVEGLMLDVRLQYALHTTSFEEQPLSDKSLSRFRKRCYDYFNKTRHRSHTENLLQKDSQSNRENIQKEVYKQMQGEEGQVVKEEETVGICLNRTRSIGWAVTAADLGG